MACQCNGNNNPLTHSARILEGVIVKPIRRVGNADTFHNADGLGFGIGFGKLLVLLDHFRNLETDGSDRIQGRHGILENRRNLHTADFRPVFFLFQFGQILSVIHNGTVGDFSVGFQHAGKGFGKDGFSASGFADNGKRFPFIQVQRNVPDRRQVPVPHAKLDLNIFCGNNNFIFHACLLPMCPRIRRIRQFLSDHIQGNGNGRQNQYRDPEQMRIPGHE